MKKSSHLISFLILGVILLVLAGGYGYSMWEIKDLQIKTDVLKSDNDSMSALLKNLDPKTAENKVEEEKADLLALEGLFVKEGEEFTLIQTVEKICSASAVECDIKPTSVEGQTDLPAGFHLLKLVVNAKGTFKNLHQLASAIENLPYQSTLSETNLALDGDLVGAGARVPESRKVWKANFNLMVTTVQ